MLLQVQNNEIYSNAVRSPSSEDLRYRESSGFPGMDKSNTADIAPHLLPEGGPYFADWSQPRTQAAATCLIGLDRSDPSVLPHPMATRGAGLIGPTPGFLRVLISSISSRIMPKLRMGSSV